MLGRRPVDKAPAAPCSPAANAAAPSAFLPPLLLLLQFAIEQARFYDKCNLQAGADRTSCQVRRAVWEAAVLQGVGDCNLGALPLPPAFSCCGCVV